MVMIVIIVVVMVVMMVMVVMFRMLAMFNVTFHFVTMLAFCLKLQCYMAYVVFAKLFAYGILDFMMISVRDYMHRSVIVISIYAPNVYMVYVDNSGDLTKMLSYISYFYVMRRFFKKEINYLLEIVYRVKENKYRNTDRHQRIDKGEICEFHHNGSYKNHYPAKYVLKHMKINCLLIYGVAATCKESGTEVYGHPDNGKNDHAVIIYGGGGYQA